MTTPTSEKAATSPTIGDEVNLFVRHIDSLQETLPLTMLFIHEVGMTYQKKVEEFEEKNCTVQVEGDIRRVSIPIEHNRKWKKLRSRHDQIHLASSLVPRSLLVSLVSQYDAFLGRLLKAIFNVRPELLNASEKALSFSQVASFPSIDAIRDHVIEKEIEGVLRSSHADQIKWIEARFGLPLTKGLKIWPTFIELTERRNLFVHTDGVVSSQYLSVCRQSGVDLKGDIDEGSRLEVRQEYFEIACRCVFELGVKLAHVLWRKLLPNDREKADSNLIMVTYELIEKENYTLAIALLDFACNTLNTYANEWNELALAVNHAQAHKWSGNEADAQKILDEVDWSAKGDEFKLAAAVLRSDWKNAVDVMRRIGSSGPVRKHNYRDWPLFKEFRNQPEFTACYQEVFKEEFPVAVKEDVVAKKELH